MKSCLLWSVVVSVGLCLSPVARAELRAGAAVADVTPSKYPVLVNGNMVSRTADEAFTRINARAIVLDDGNERLGIVVVDSCMIDRPTLDEAKELAAQKTQLRPDRILISATHTHSAPSSMGALGTEADTDYLPVLRAGIAEALAKAEANLEPAKVGWGMIQAPDYTAVRRWIRRPDRIEDDPFGNPTVRATMHAGADWNVAIGESGPEDPDLSLLSIQSIDGRPIAVLANFSMHYFSGPKPLDYDYFGRFCSNLAGHVAAEEQEPAFVGIMSHGCSGDIWRRDYTQEGDAQLPHNDIDEFAGGLADLAFEAYQSISYEADADLAMAEARPTLNYRVPDLQLLEWAQRVVDELGDRAPETGTEVYAREQIILHERQSTEIVLQAIRIGSFGIATTPNETYALTGMKIKQQSPLPQTMVIELANGGDGYIPPPEQHLLGGYNTWPARSAGLEVQAEPKIVATDLRLLEEVAGRPRREWEQSCGPLAEATLATKPLAYWRLDETAGPWAHDASGNERHATYQLPVAFFLEGPHADEYCIDGEVNRAAHFVDGQLQTPLTDLGDQFSVSLWCWNGMPSDAREVTGWMMSCGEPGDELGHGELLGLGGTSTQPGRLVVSTGTGEPAVGTTEIPRWSWNHVAFVRDGGSIRVYLNGAAEPEITATASGDTSGLLTFGGIGEGTSNWEGRLDEIAVFDRALSPEEAGQLAGSR